MPVVLDSQQPRSQRTTPTEPTPSTMPIPPFHEMLLPLLRRSGDGREWPVAALRAPIADDFSLTAAERQELLPSNTQSRFVNRLCWAKIYLERAGLITRVRRGVFTISAAGRAVLAENPAAITLAYLDRFDSFRKFREARTTADGTAELPSRSRPSRRPTPSSKGPTKPSTTNSPPNSSTKSPTAHPCSSRRSCSTSCGRWATAAGATPPAGSPAKAPTKASTASSTKTASASTPSTSRPNAGNTQWADPKR